MGAKRLEVLLLIASEFDLQTNSYIDLQQLRALKALGIHDRKLHFSIQKNTHARLQLCASECANQARDKLPSNATESQVKNAQREILACSQKCVDNQLSKGLPALIIRLKDQLQKLKQNQIHIAN
ncbi:uncharacterized protein DC041_0004437 [Schistosoma bovis]|uniref:Uncharacterized protein n=1 Tax=Schistosoma bovis TaxID=6184 RepID=A0A430QGX6_SCHBO|nr:uncharacterized protein DC041_0004437 [Schistosoma bovis]